MGNSATCKQNACECKLGGDSEGNGEVVDEQGGETVNLDLIPQKKAIQPISPASGDGRRPAALEERRPPFQVQLERSGKNWRTIGLLVSPDDDPSYLIVDDIWSPSLISEWNDAHDEQVRVRAGDIIRSVNDCKKKTGEEMLALIQQTGKGATLKLDIE
mmetsp:Transcript_43564/g.138718  ORF Transcript_43564/g.138718 Transcript_43564/m.138718 type:complete len:159 (+) Transcript_43564:124-600(+)